MSQRNGVGDDDERVIRLAATTSADEEVTSRHSPFAVIEANASLTRAVARALEGDLAEVSRAIDALPPSHPRRRLLFSNLMKAVALLQDLPGILAR